MRFEKLRHLVVDQVYKQDTDMELLFDVLGLFSFYDKQAIDFLYSLARKTQGTEMEELQQRQLLK